MKKTIILGLILGLVMPVVGIFFGLQISGVLGTILSFPLIAVSFATGVPFGVGNEWVWIIAFGLSILVWMGIVAGVRKVLQ